MNWSAPIHTSLLPSPQPAEEPFHCRLFFHRLTAGRRQGSRRGTRHSSSGTFLGKSTFINEIKYRSAEIIISPRRSTQFFPVSLNYKVKQDRLNSKTRATYEVLAVCSVTQRRCGGGGGGGGVVVWEDGTSGPADLTGNIISSPGFQGNCLSERKLFPSSRRPI